MNWMLNKYAAGYGDRMKNMRESVNRLYDALGIVRFVPDAPATRRYDLDKERIIKL